MDFRSSNSSILTQPVSSPAETQPLLSPIAMPTLRERLYQACALPRHLCLPSKAAVLILFWSTIVGTAYTLAKDATVAIGIVLANDKINGHKLDNVLVNILIPYVCLALVMLLYPLSGFIADIWCGRYKSVIISMCILMFSFVGFAVGCSLTLIDQVHHITIHHPELLNVGKDFLIIVVVLAFVLFIIGLSGFQANFIQLGLDQLHEAPSEYLGIFVHWAMWAGTFTAPFSRILFTAYACTQSDGLLYGLYSLPIVCSIGFSLLLVFSCCKHHWFYTEPGQDNPYKMVISVLRFAKKHSYPLQRSAFTFDDGEVASRIDFAKQRYGGPFLTKQVEDVKSFLRILVVLMALGPIYILEVPASNFVFPSFALHTGLGPAFEDCTARWLILESGTLGELVPVFGLPIYIWLIYSFLRRCVPKILTRLFVGGSLLFLGVFIMSTTDLFGHLFLKKVDNLTDIFHGKGDGEAYCMFNLDVTSEHAKALNLSWGVHVIPNILIGISPILITTTTFEFISAQSPHSMKGLLVGMFFAIKGLFQLLSAFLLLPFSLPNYWTTRHPKEVNCGFGYLFIVSGLAFISLVIFSAVAKKYKYRERDDPPYDQMVVEEVYARNINQTANQTRMYSPDSVNGEFTNSFPIHTELH